MSRYAYDSTTGTETLIAGNAGTNDNFVGTIAEWNTLTISEKAEYKTVDFTDDYNGYSIDNTPTQNSNNVVKSGGVYSALSEKVNISDIANNLTTTTEGKVLDARQGNALNEALAKQTLYFTSVACTATTGNFATVSNANISADHVVVECTFANPSAITTDVTWTTANGSLTLNGTCASATTANITLSKKGN